jgi:flagellar hook-associated protein 3 FlgL
MRTSTPIRGAFLVLAALLAIALAAAWLALRDDQRVMRTEVAKRLTDADAALAQSRQRESTLANELRGYQNMILGAANVKSSDRFLFGGSGFGTAPFTLSSSGDLLYNGVNVNAASFPEEHRYVDIGLDLSVSSGGTVSPLSALDVAYSGATLLGTGVDANGLPNNLYNLIGEIAGKLETGDLSDIDTYSGKLEQRADDVRMQYVSIGEKSNYISFFTDRLSSEKITATSKQNNLESLSLEEGAIMFSQQELMYNACLQMGTKILQPSLLDYLNS